MQLSIHLDTLCRGAVSSVEISIDQDRRRVSCYVQEARHWDPNFRSVVYVHGLAVKARTGHKIYGGIAAFGLETGELREIYASHGRCGRRVVLIGFRDDSELREISDRAVLGELRGFDRAQADRIVARMPTRILERLLEQYEDGGWSHEVAGLAGRELEKREVEDPRVAQGLGLATGELPS